MRKQRLHIVLIVLALAAGVIVYLQITRRSGALAYQGRSISGWMKRLPGQSFAGGGIPWYTSTPARTSAELQAEDAVRHIGTNALPFLLQAMRAKESRLEQALRGLADRLQFHFFRASITEHQQWDAARAIRTLGPLAKPAIPELVKLLNKMDTSRNAAAALSGIGPDGLPPLIQATTNRVVWFQLSAIWALGQIPSDQPAGVSALVACLRDTSSDVRMAAAWALEQHYSDPELVAPALALNLGDTSPNVRPFTERALKAYGIKDVSTAALLEYLENPTLHVRMAATNALKTLDPAAAAKAGIK